MNTETGDAGLIYAGFWVRVWAFTIDSTLVSLIVFPILISVYGTGYFSSDNFIEGPMDFLIVWVFPAIAVIVFWIYKSASPGKMAVSARIVDARTGNQPSNAQFIGRYFAYYVSLFPLGLGFLWVAFDRRKQGWHDKLAGTVVVRQSRTGPEKVSFGKSA